MMSFVLRRLGQMAFTVIVASFLIFAVSEWTPGSAARKMLGPYALPEQVESLSRELGLDRPVLVRYVEWAGNVLQGDLGYSTLYKQPVAPVFADRLKNTAMLAAIAFAIIVPVSILFGIMAGMREGSLFDRGISVAAILCTSLPEFALGAFLSSIFVIWLGILPGTSTLQDSGGWSVASQLVLPVAVMVLYDAGYVIRMVRASMIEVMLAPYIRTAILKGMSFRQVITRHALRNALIAPFTVILLQINYLITGVVVVEAVFAYPGFGRMMLDAALNKDVALIEAGALVAVGIAVTTQVAGDIGYMLLNPRIRIA
ncbi:MAG TPA: ABC transporter permease [Geminicoccus sp.]|jgi:peptide/nickel transport system permease protein|uniref:ABC transporter permease n=1 Tax=Geminicoccus sp. TaxID=2024832 RepID=UPI002E322679|nr:ABC transporter permease [Geminicoccus sp.]HEX2525785.1 ABC transporter permease [Geminicoccus sp.]